MGGVRSYSLPSSSFACLLPACLGPGRQVTRSSLTPPITAITSECKRYLKELFTIPFAKKSGVATQR